MSETQFSGRVTEQATEVGPGRMAGYRAEQRSIRESRISRLSLLAVVVAAFVAVCACRDEVEFVVGDIFSNFRSSPPYAAAEGKAKLTIPDLQKPVVRPAAIAAK
jgi:hypothetical protein